MEFGVPQVFRGPLEFYSDEIALDQLLHLLHIVIDGSFGLSNAEGAFVSGHVERVTDLFPDDDGKEIHGKGKYLALKIDLFL